MKVGGVIKDVLILAEVKGFNRRFLKPIILDELNLELAVARKI